MRKALLISYRFPPQGGGGVQRSLKFTKYLREYGWEPVVHTASNPFWPMHDETLLEEIPAGVRVYRSPAFEFERLEQRLRGIGRGGRKSEPRVPRAADRPAGAEHEPAQDRGLLGRLSATVHRRLLIPDPQIAWLPGALVKSLLIARRERVALVYTSSPPNSVQILGRLVARGLGLPWVADFRDPWTDGIRRRQAYVGNRLRERLEQAAERSVILGADRVLVTTDPARACFLEKYPELTPERVVVVTNGFDPADFAAAAASQVRLEPGRFHLTVTGNIEAMFDARPFLRALAELVAENADLARDLRLTLVGTKRGKYDADISALGLEERVRYTGYVPHGDSIRYLQQSDVLVLCQIPEHGSAAVKLSGKLFEYIYVRKPVLALTIPGVTTELLARAGLGTVVHPADLAGIKAAIRELYASRGGAPRGDAAAIAQFDRRRLTERLAGIFDQLTGSAPRARVAA